MLHPKADAYTNASERNKNFGTSETLRLDGQPEMIAYLHFDIPKLKDEPGLKKAVLRLYAHEASERGIAVYIADDRDWEETRITYNNAPRMGGRSVQSVSIKEGGWFEIDVTSLVRGKSEISLVLTVTGDSEVSFSSRETGDYAPQLLITSQKKEYNDDIN